MRDGLARQRRSLRRLTTLSPLPPPSSLIPPSCSKAGYKAYKSGGGISKCKEDGISSKEFQEAPELTAGPSGSPPYIPAKKWLGAKGIAGPSYTAFCPCGTVLQQWIAWTGPAGVGLPLAGVSASCVGPNGVAFQVSCAGVCADVLMPLVLNVELAQTDAAPAHTMPHPAQVFPVPPGVLLLTSAPKAGGYSSVSGSTGPLFLFNVGGAGSAGPTAFKHKCPQNTVVVGFEVSGSGGERQAGRRRVGTGTAGSTWGHAVHLPPAAARCSLVCAPLPPIPSRSFIFLTQQVASGVGMDKTSYARGIRFLCGDPQCQKDVKPGWTRWLGRETTERQSKLEVCPCGSVIRSISVWSEADYSRADDKQPLSGVTAACSDGSTVVDNKSNTTTTVDATRLNVFPGTGPPRASRAFEDGLGSVTALVGRYVDRLLGMGAGSGPSAVSGQAYVSEHACHAWKAAEHGFHQPNPLPTPPHLPAVFSDLPRRTAGGGTARGLGAGAGAGVGGPAGRPSHIL